MTQLRRSWSLRAATKTMAPAPSNANRTQPFSAPPVSPADATHRTLRSIQHGQSVFLKPLVGGHNGQLMPLRLRDDESITRVVVNRREFRGGDAYVEVQRKEGQAAVVDDLVKPLRCWQGQLEFSVRRFDGNLKAADCGNVNGGRLVDFHQGRTVASPRDCGQPEQGARVQHHRYASGHSSAESGSTGS